MTRLAKLEGRKSRPPLPKLVFTLDDHEQAGGVTGYRLGNVTILKLAGEDAQQCLDRAFRMVPDATSAAALYPAQECGQHASWPAPAETPSDALSGPENGPRDPFALAGVGRQATRAELERMGAIRVPPERLL